MKKVFALVPMFFLVCGFMSSARAVDVFTLDKVHSSIGFAVPHMMISKTTGAFTDYDAVIRFDAGDLANSRFDFTVRAASIDTRNEARDQHLRGADFFAVEQYPLITFTTKNIKQDPSGVYQVTGDLTMKDVTREVVIPVTVSGPVSHPVSGGFAIGLEARFSLDRQEYNIKWNKALDNNGLMIGNLVNVDVYIEANKAAQ